jgi:hypothetical protein
MGQKSCRPRHPRPQAVPRHAHARVLTPSTIPRPISRLATCWETVGFTGSSTPEARAGPDLGWPLQKPKSSRRYLIVCLRHPTVAFLARPASAGSFLHEHAHARFSYHVFLGKSAPIGTSKAPTTGIRTVPSANPTTASHSAVTSHAIAPDVSPPATEYAIELMVS